MILFFILFISASLSFCTNYTHLIVTEDGNYYCEAYKRKVREIKTFNQNKYAKLCYNYFFEQTEFTIPNQQGGQKESMQQIFNLNNLSEETGIKGFFKYMNRLIDFANVSLTDSKRIKEIKQGLEKEFCCCIKEDEMLKKIKGAIIENALIDAKSTQSINKNRNQKKNLSSIKNEKLLNELLALMIVYHESTERLRDNSSFLNYIYEQLLDTDSLRLTAQINNKDNEKDFKENIQNLYLLLNDATTMHLGHL